MAESLGQATLTLGANPGPLMGSLAAARAKTVASMRGSGAASAAAFTAGMLAVGTVVGFGLYKIAKIYDDAANQIKIQTGATGEELESLKATFKDVYGQTASDAKTVADALSEVRKRTGLLGKPLEELTLQFVRLSGITGTDVKTNVRAVTRAFNDWGIKTKDQGKKLDGFFALSQKTGISVSDLGEKMSMFGSPLRALGFGFDQTASMLAVFEKAGVNVSTMMPGFKMALANLTKPTDDFAKRLKGMGISAKDPRKALAELIDKIKTMGDEGQARGLALELFGKRAGPDMAQSIREGKLEVNDLIKVMKNSKGAVEDAVPATFEGRLKMLGHIITNELEPAATKILGVLIDVAGKLVEWGRALDGLPQPVKDAAGKVVLFAGGMGILAVAIGKAKAAFMAMKLAMLANPYVLIIAATVAIGVLIYKNWNEIKAFLADTWKKIRKGIDSAWKGITNLFRKHWQVLAAIPLGPMGVLVVLISKNWGKIRELTGTVWRKIRDLITVPFKAAAGVVRSVANSVREKLVGTWDKIKAVTGSAWGKIKNWIVTPFSYAYNAVVGLLNSLKSAMKSAFEYVSRKVSEIWEKVKSLPGKIPVLGGAAKAVGFSSAISPASFSSPVASASSSFGGGSASPVDVQVTFADGMGWLKEFVDVRISDADRAGGQVYAAGGGGFA